MDPPIKLPIFYYSLLKCYVSAVGLDRSPSPGSLRSHWLGHLPSLASPARFGRSKSFIECYRNIIKSSISKSVTLVILKTGFWSLKPKTRQSTNNAVV